MFSVFAPELLAIITGIAILLITGVIVFYNVNILPRIQASEFFKRYEVLMSTVYQVVSDTVLRIASTDEDLTRFEEQARETGRDVRLVAAMYYIDRYTTNTLGLQIDEEYIISMVEARLAELKNNGVIAISSTDNTPTQEIPALYVNGAG